MGFMLSDGEPGPGAPLLPSNLPPNLHFLTLRPARRCPPGLFPASGPTRFPAAPGWPPPRFPALGRPWGDPAPSAPRSASRVLLPLPNLHSPREGKLRRSRGKTVVSRVRAGPAFREGESPGVGPRSRGSAHLQQRHDGPAAEIGRSR